MYVIPAIDIIDGKCVRLTKGDYAQKKIYNENPLEVALEFEANGIKKLHLVDLDGAKAQKVVNWKVLEQIANKTNLEIDFGGGIKSNDSFKIVIESGAKQVTCGTIAVKKPEIVLAWLEKYGSETIILGSDVKERKIVVHGWQETSNLDLISFLGDYIEKGIQFTICTDVNKDGMLEGASIELYEEIINNYKDLKVIASGGVTALDELYELKECGCYGAIIGKAIYEGKLLLKDLQVFA